MKRNDSALPGMEPEVRDDSGRCIFVYAQMNRKRLMKQSSLKTAGCTCNFFCNVCESLKYEIAPKDFNTNFREK